MASARLMSKASVMRRRLRSVRLYSALSMAPRYVLCSPARKAKLWLDVRQQLDNMPERFNQLTLDLKKQVGRLLDAKADEARLLLT